VIVQFAERDGKTRLEGDAGLDARTCGRHMQVFACPHHALGLVLVSNAHLLRPDRSPDPDCDNRHHVLSLDGQRRLDYASLHGIVSKHLVEHLDRHHQSGKVTHIGRGTAAKAQQRGGVSEMGIRRSGKWNLNNATWSGRTWRTTTSTACSS
jgi:hypothetical protein